MLFFNKNKENKRNVPVFKQFNIAGRSFSVWKLHNAGGLRRILWWYWYWVYLKEFLIASPQKRKKKSKSSAVHPVISP